MGISAVYGTAVYGQSYYGRMYVKGSSASLFSNLGHLSAGVEARGSSLLEFQTSGRIDGGRTGEIKVVISSQGKIISSGTAGGSTGLLFGSSSRLTSGTTGSASFTFSTSGVSKLFGEVSAESSLLFKSSSLLRGGRTGKISSVFSTLSKVTKGTTGSSSLEFSSSSSLVAAPSKIIGSAMVLFGYTGRGTAQSFTKGSTSLEFQTLATIEGPSKLTGETTSRFIPTRAITNANKIFSYAEIHFYGRAEVTYQNRNPFYSNWDGSYQVVSTETDNMIGYRDLLLDRTNGQTQKPYVETIE